MTSIQDLLDPELKGLLGELAEQPTSLLFGNPKTPKPDLWTGREPGLSNVEKEILRAHREALGYHVRMLSAGAQLRLDSGIGWLDADFRERATEFQDEIKGAPARAVQIETICSVSSGRASVQKDTFRQLVASASEGPPGEASHAAVELVQEVNSVLPHSFHYQILASWYLQLKAVRAAQVAAKKISYLGTKSEHRWRSLRTLGDVAHESGEFRDAATYYLQSSREVGQDSSWMLALLNAVLSGDQELAVRVWGEFGTQAPRQDLLEHEVRHLGIVVGARIPQLRSQVKAGGAGLPAPMQSVLEFMLGKA